jgi:hypothetical protein
MPLCGSARRKQPMHPGSDYGFGVCFDASRNKTIRGLVIAGHRQQALYKLQALDNKMRKNVYSLIRSVGNHDILEATHRT